MGRGRVGQQQHIRKAAAWIQVRFSLFVFAVKGSRKIWQVLKQKKERQTATERSSNNKVLPNHRALDEGASVLNRMLGKVVIDVAGGIKFVYTAVL